MGFADSEQPHPIEETVYYKIINRKKRIATRIADLVGYALWAPSNLFKKKIKETDQGA